MKLRKFKNKDLIMSVLAEIISKHPEKEAKALMFAELEFFQKHIYTEKDMDKNRARILNIYEMYYICKKKNLFKLVEKKEKEIMKSAPKEEIDLNAEQIIYIDVRTAQEVEQEPRSDQEDYINICSTEIKAEDLDKTKLYVIKCKSGARAERVGDDLQKLGFRVIETGGLD